MTASFRHAIVHTIRRYLFTPDEGNVAADIPRWCYQHRRQQAVFLLLLPQHQPNYRNIDRTPVRNKSVAVKEACQHIDRMPARLSIIEWNKHELVSAQYRSIPRAVLTDECPVFRVQ